MSETAVLVITIFAFAFFVFLSVSMLISFIKDKDVISFILMATYFLMNLFWAYGLFTELFGR